CEAHHSAYSPAPLRDRRRGLVHGVATDVPGEMVETAGRENRQRKPGFDGDSGCGRHRAVAAADCEYLRTRGNAAQYLDRLVAGLQFADLCLREFGAHLVDDTSARALARR